MRLWGGKFGNRQYYVYTIVIYISPMSNIMGSSAILWSMTLLRVLGRMLLCFNLHRTGAAALTLRCTLWVNMIEYTIKSITEA